MAVHVSLEFTPNPDTLKYTVSQPLLDRGALDFTDAAKAADAPLAQRLFAVSGVKAVMIGRDFVTVTVTGQDVLAEVNATVQREIKEHLEAGEPVFTGTRPDREHGEGTSEIDQQIISMLDEQIRPAVAMDGGDIVFDRFDGGIVYLELKGSCAGCPSSIATLKMGIEQFLRERIPEVQEVQAV